MSENQAETTNEALSWQEKLQGGVGKLFSSWKVKVGFIVTVIVGIVIGGFYFTYFWHHWVAELGMKKWSNSSGAKPIECMIQDTNGDQYVSCTALLKGEVVPLECGASIFNVGCRVNYGAAAPSIRPSKS